MEVLLGELYHYKWIIPNVLKVSGKFRKIKSLNTSGKCVSSLVVLLPADPEQHLVDPEKHPKRTEEDENESNRKQPHREQELLLLMH